MPYSKKVAGGALVAAAMMLCPIESFAAPVISPGFELLAWDEPGDPLGFGLGTGWVGHPEGISNVDDYIGPIPATSCGPNAFFFPGVGCQNTGNTSVILERTQPVGPSDDTTLLDFVGLSLKSVGDVVFPGDLAPSEPASIRIFKDFNASPSGAQVFGGVRPLLPLGAAVTPCNPAVPGTSTNSCMEIKDDGTASMWLSYRATLIGQDSGRKAAVDFNVGPGIGGANFNYGNTPPQNGNGDDPFVQIALINFLLNGVDSDEDFWREASVPGDGIVFTPATTPVPLPPALPLLAGAIAGLIGLRRGRRQT